MKLLVLTSVVFTALSANASDNAARVNLQASSPTQMIQLVDQSFAPIYESQPYEATCSRQVLDHTETTCETLNDNVCHGGGEVCTTQNDSVCNSGGCTIVPRRVCHTEPEVCVNVPRRVCSDHNVFRTEFYSCTQYHDVVVGQRLVKTFNHQIEVTVANPAILGGASIAVDVIASQADLSARLDNSFAAGLLNYQISKISESDSGSLLNRSEKMVIDLAMSSSDVKAIDQVSISDLALGRDALRFNLANSSRIADHLSVAIKLVRHRSIFANSTLYDSSIEFAKLGLVGQGENISALIPYQKLGIDAIKNAKYDLSISVKLNPGTASLLNADEFRSELDRHIDQSLSKVNPSF